MTDLPPAYRLVAHERLGSTSDEARRLAREGAEDGTLVWAKEQTGGRGRRGNAWVSPPGNLYGSLVLRPEAAPSRFGELGFVAALAVGETLGAFVPPLTELRYKWPNDVLLGGRKASGILLESESGADWLVMGVGINVAHHPDGATSIHAEAGAEATVEAVLERFSRAFLAWANRWLDDGFPPVRAAWLRRALALGEAIEARLPRETLRGRFVDLDAAGALLLDTPAGRRTITAGEVFAL